MSLLRLIPELPLLRRELIELSNRQRTYIVRFIGAIIFLTFVVFKFNEQMNAASSLQMASANAPIWNPNKFLGSGGLVFAAIVPMLFNCVRMLMPALICSSITIEKERNTLGTLFVTRLTPFTIVLEKLGSRLVPMFTFLLLTFPVLAFVYSLGGVDTSMLLNTLLLLVGECVLFACIGLMCSSWFSTTVTAFIWAYVLTGFLIVFSVFLRSRGGLSLTPFDVWATLNFGYDDYGQGSLWLSPSIFQMRKVSAGSSYLAILGSLVTVSLSCLPAMSIAFACLMMARFFLIRRAFVSSSSALLRVFKKVDSIFLNLNRITDRRYLMWVLHRGPKPDASTVTRGIVLIRDHESLPLFDAVAWRERAKKSMGKARYLFRILVAMEGPTLFICLTAASYSASTNFSGLRALLALIWGISAVILAVKASTMISSERTRETLDALLSTPMSSREIIEQKIAGMQRLMIVLAIPILSVHFTLLLMHFDLRGMYRNPNMIVIIAFVLYCVLSVVSTYSLMQVIAWISTLMGIRSTTQARSVMAAFTALAAIQVISGWVFQPSSGLFQAMIGETDYWTNTPSVDFNRESREWPRVRNDAIVSTVSCLFRPDGSIQANEGILVAASSARVSEGSFYYYLGGTLGVAFSASLIVCGWHLMLMRILRRVTLKLAPRLLGRLDQAVDQQESSEVLTGLTLVKAESMA